ncbi:MAG: hypothetical protein MUF71_17545 [Candidatus Kapabacteria bacterium]|nr:hypothetical protein [Candidatus Kapabacteria bacterium]
MSSLHPFVAETLKHLHISPEEAARAFAISATKRKLELLQSERNQLEQKYQMSFEDFEKRILARQNEEIFEESDDYNDWMFSVQLEPILAQRLQKLEHLEVV